jgi:hypothetical protein
MKRYILQTIANFIGKACQHAPSEPMFYYYYELGAMLNAYAIELHGIYLD